MQKGLEDVKGVVGMPGSRPRHKAGGYELSTYDSLRGVRRAICQVKLNDLNKREVYLRIPDFTWYKN